MSHLKGRLIEWKQWERAGPERYSQVCQREGDKKQENDADDEQKIDEIIICAESDLSGTRRSFAFVDKAYMILEIKWMNT